MDISEVIEALWFSKVKVTGKRTNFGDDKGLRIEDPLFASILWTEEEYLPFKEIAQRAGRVIKT